MARYAVVRMKKRQYIVKQGDEIEVDRLGDSKMEPELLLKVDGKDVKIGKPLVTGSKVKIKVLQEEVRGDKIYVQKYKAKSRYRRKIGFRPQYTKLLIEKIA